jgi:hypothetical protein
MLLSPASHSGPPSSSFGNDSYPSSSARDTARRESFDEYDAGDDEVRSPAASAPPARKSTASSASVPRPVKKDPPPPAAPAKQVNLFDFEDDEPAVSGPAPAAAKPAHNRTLSFDGALLCLALYIYHADTFKTQTTLMTSSLPPPLQLLQLLYKLLYLNKLLHELLHPPTSST